MKRNKLFLIILVSLSFYPSTAVNALEVKVTNKTDNKKKKPKKVDMLGKNLNVEEEKKPYVEPGASGNIFYNATIAKKAPPPATPVATPTPPPVAESGNGIVNRATVQRNQTKESYISNGMRLLDEDNFDAAMSEFKKAQSIYNDPLIQRWIEITVNKKKIAQVNKIIADMTATR